jgi:catechol 2,3-dioxygenase-like lactoylglutathione lyase family enzyme
VSGFAARLGLSILAAGTPQNLEHFGLSHSTEFRRAIPLLPAQSVPDTATFYREKFGFEVLDVNDEYAVIRRGPLEIHLWQCRDRYVAESTSCRIEVVGVAALYEHCHAAGTIHPGGELELKRTGYREFSALDDAGNMLVFVERAE